jgi:hypothetical protein
VHYRFALENKPKYYKNIAGKIYLTEEYKKELEDELGEQLISISSFRTTKLPDCLNDDWWEIEDWANFYKYLTGELPTA